jgi:hypothetical protein
MHARQKLLNKRYYRGVRLTLRFTRKNLANDRNSQ